MKIEAGKQHDIPEIARLLTDAFFVDPVMKEYVAWSTDKRAALAGFFTAELETFYLPRGVVDVVRGDDGLLGAALWATPERPMRRRDVVRQLPALIRALGPSFPRALYLASFDNAAAPAFTHWYLFTIVVSPQAQGHGIGGALLDHGIERAGNNAIYLESTTAGSQRLYERKGFISLGRIPSPLPTSEVGMWRPGANSGNE
ncbi:MAG: GNAT family N-acetyltransferase [Ancrocorticia sp.]|nr:GNAT family N-acetyltransferase [Ancrocorticia sp.]MCI1896627.1 GNAT family N-acetyltransferase [Ancrocorticia sp.]MCI1933252.1 GNAT family N-acetyltransferase [Ancrocorticia sp.]MCI1963873.1 GNAT family N-acetyltransferase [Ancrocorticia sp.]MCI2001556.1 GNAT family N-acetyltransferase [Ancrocorticia sp.]